MKNIRLGYFTVNKPIKFISNLLSKNIFVAPVVINIISIAYLLILLTFIGQSDMVADVAIVQGAIHTVFIAYSASTINLIYQRLQITCLDSNVYLDFT